MSCYHPLIGYRSDEVGDNGKRKVKIISLHKGETIDDFSHLGAFLIPCGHCIGCRLDYSRKWADRMMLELDSSDSALFVTLTYDNEHVHWSQFNEFDQPLFATLDKRDCQLFLKRLRKYFSGRSIRYFLAGEYGDHTLRPHYHAILFGVGLCDFPDYVRCGRNDLKQPYYKSQKFNEIWSLGNVLLADVSWQTCAYVARYVTKKLNNDLSLSYAKRNVLPEFALMSRRPGLGSEYLNAHPDSLDYSSINLKTPEGGLKIDIPKYYLRKLQLTDHLKYVTMMESRRLYASDTQLLELQRTDLDFKDYLCIKESEKKAKLCALKRKV